MQKHILAVTAAGATGSATGSASIILGGAGKLYGAYLDLATNVTSDTCIRIEALSPAVSVFVLAGVTAASADGWYFPRESTHTNTGASYTSTTALIQYPIVGSLAVRVGSSTPTAAAVTAYVYVDEI